MQRCTKWYTLADESWETKDKQDYHHDGKENDEGERRRRTTTTTTASTSIAQLELKLAMVYMRENDMALIQRKTVQAKQMHRSHDEDQTVENTHGRDDEEEQNLAHRHYLLDIQDEETEDEAAHHAQELERLERQRMEAMMINIPRGDYQIQVHIIEARDLKGENVRSSQVRLHLYIYI